MGADEARRGDDPAVASAYQEVCRSTDRIEDFRARLLGLLPAVSGAGILIVTGRNSDVSKEALGTFGAVSTIGLLFYELRGIQRCIRLSVVGKELETTMGVKGQFALWPQSVGRFVNEPIASAFVYSTVLAAWVFLAFGATKPAAIPASLLSFVVAFAMVWCFYLRVREPNKFGDIRLEPTAVVYRGEKCEIAHVMASVRGRSLNVIGPGLHVEERIPRGRRLAAHLFATQLMALAGKSRRKRSDPRPPTSS